MLPPNFEYLFLKMIFSRRLAFGQKIIGGIGPIEMRVAREIAHSYARGRSGCAPNPPWRVELLANCDVAVSSSFGAAGAPGVVARRGFRPSTKEIGLVIFKNSKPIFAEPSAVV